MNVKRKFKLVKLFTNQQDKKRSEDVPLLKQELTNRHRMNRYEPLPAIAPRPKLVRENTYKVIEPQVIRTPQDYFKYRIIRAKSDGICDRIGLQRQPCSSSVPGSTQYPDRKYGRTPREPHLDPLPPSSHGRTSRSSVKSYDKINKIQEKPEKIDAGTKKRRIPNIKNGPKLKPFEADQQKNAFWIPV